MAGLRLFRFRGIDVIAHPSLLFIAVVQVGGLAAGRFPAELPGLSGAAYWGMGVAGAAAFILSILLHEFGHALVALRQGLMVPAITLWAFGGVAWIGGGSHSPGREFAVAAAGPAVTAAIAAGVPLATGGPGASWSPEALAVLRWVGTINLILLIFNLIPAYPLDGGRILHSIVWRVGGNLTSATRVASISGQGFGVFLMAGGGFFLLLGRFDGLWAAVIGWMLFKSAKAADTEYSQPIPDTKVRAGHIMTREFGVVTPDTTVAQLAEAMGTLRARHTFVVMEGGTPLGLMTPDRLDAVPEAGRGAAVSEVMIPRDDITPLHVDDSLPKVVKALETGAGTVVVLAGDSVVGLISTSHIARLETEGEMPA